MTVNLEKLSLVSCLGNEPSMEQKIKMVFTILVFKKIKVNLRNFELKVEEKVDLQISKISSP